MGFREPGMQDCFFFSGFPSVEIQPTGSGGGHLKCSEEAAAWKSLIAPATDFSTNTEVEN